MVDGSKAAQYLDKDPKAFGAGVKRLFLAGSAGGEKLREILAPPPEKMDAEASPRARGGLLGGYAIGSRLRSVLDDDNAHTLGTGGAS